MQAEHLCKLTAVIVPANEQVCILRFRQPGTGRYDRRSNLAAIQIQPKLTFIPIEHGIYIRPFILGQFTTVR
ncbi:hypothetical protein D3C75_429480 [compost metagenome]